MAEDNKNLTPADLAEANRLLKEEQAIRETLLGVQAEQVAQEEISKELKASRLAALEVESQNTKKMLDLEIERLAKAQAEGKLTQDQIKAQVALLKGLKQVNDEKQKELEATLKIKKAEEEAAATKAAALDRMENEFGKTLQKFTLIGDGWRTGFMGAMADVMESGADTGEVMGRLAKKMKDNFSMKNIAGSFVGNVIQQTTLAVNRMDQAYSDFTRNTGQAMTDQQADMAMSVSDSQQTMGVTMDVAVNNLGELTKGISDFRSLSTTAKKATLEQATAMERLGVSVHQTSEFMNFAQKSMGMTTDESITMQNSLFSLSQNVAASQSELQSQMISMAPKLAAFGKNAERVFKRLAIQADKTGVSIDKLAAIGDKFSTFRDAASNVGRLNQLLKSMGGSGAFDMRKLVNMDTAEQLEYIQDVMQKSGIDAQNMGMHMKRAFAGVLTGGDVAAFMGLFENEVSATDKALADMGMTQEEVNKAAEDATPVMMILKATMDKFVVAIKPIVETLRAVVGWFADLDPTVIRVIGIVLIVIGVILFLSKVIGAFAAILAPITALTGGASAGIVSLGAAGMAAAGGIGMLGLAMIKLGAGVALFGLGVLMAAGALYIIVLAFAKLIEMPLGELTVDILALAGGMGLMLLAGIGALVGFAGLAVGIALLGIALLTVKTDDLQALATIFESVAKAKDPPFAAWTTGIKSFAVAADETMISLLGLMNMISVASIMADLFGNNEGVEATTRLFSAVSKIDSEDIEGIREVRELVTELRIAGETDTASAIAKMIEAMDKISKRKQEIPPIIVKVGKHELIKIISDNSKNVFNPKRNKSFSGIGN
tara:strand:+ start:8220 stop:10712 length:2493 start_codon:yes stop_codon:yes gene_type:complete